MKKTSFLIYLVPFILLLVLVLLFQGSTDKKAIKMSQPPENPEIINGDFKLVASDRALIGAPDDDDMGSGSGSAHIFELGE